jgi:uncharacterized protein (UPF0332 family)
MMPEQQDLLLKAGNKLASAKVIMREGFPEDTVSRAYYSMFYIAQSLLLNVGFTGKSHRGIISAFGENLAMTGRVPTEFHRLLIDAENLEGKLTMDYGLRNSFKRFSRWGKLPRCSSHFSSKPTVSGIKGRYK